MSPHPSEQHPILRDLLSRLDSSQRDFYEERSAVLEFEAGVSRDLAEALAILDLARLNPMALSGITVIQIELDGATEWLVTTDANYACTYLATIHAQEIAVLNLADVLAQQYCGVALLTTLG